MPERALAPSACNDSKESAAGIAVYLGDADNCTHRLRRPRAVRNPAIPIQSTDNSVALADGSFENPINLPGIKKYNGETVTEFIVRLSDGSLAAWNVGNFTGRKKLILDNGAIKLVDDLLPDLFASEICSGACGDIDSAIGVKTIVDSCPGQPSVTRYQIVRVPKCCCSSVDIHSLIG